MWRTRICSPTGSAASSRTHSSGDMSATTSAKRDAVKEMDARRARKALSTQRGCGRQETLAAHMTHTKHAVQRADILDAQCGLQALRRQKEAPAGTSVHNALESSWWVWLPQAGRSHKTLPAGERMHTARGASREQATALWTTLLLALCKRWLPSQTGGGGAGTGEEAVVAASTSTASASGSEGAVEESRTDSGAEDSEEPSEQEGADSASLTGSGC